MTENRAATVMPGDHPSLVTPALDPAAVPPRIGSGCPEPFRSRVQGREKRDVGEALGLTRFGVNLVCLPSGAMSSVRHWHRHQGEFIDMLSGEVVLVTDADEQMLRPGHAAGFPAGWPDMHHMIDRSAEDVLYLKVILRSATERPAMSVPIRMQISWQCPKTANTSSHARTARRPDRKP